MSIHFSAFVIQEFWTAKWWCSICRGFNVMIISTFRDFRILIVKICTINPGWINIQLCFFNCGSFPIPSVHVCWCVWSFRVDIGSTYVLFLLTDFQEVVPSREWNISFLQPWCLAYLSRRFFGRSPFSVGYVNFLEGIVFKYFKVFSHDCNITLTDPEAKVLWLQISIFWSENFTNPVVDAMDEACCLSTSAQHCPCLQIPVCHCYDCWNCCCDNMFFWRCMSPLIITSKNPIGPIKIIA